MGVKVRIPTPLRKVTNGLSEIMIDCSDINGLISELDKEFPSLKERICDEDGKLRRFVNVYVNEEDIRFLNGSDTPLNDGDEVSIVPAIAGG